MPPRSTSSHDYRTTTSTPATPTSPATSTTVSDARYAAPVGASNESPTPPLTRHLKSSTASRSTETRSEVKHGSRQTYERHLCRCKDCCEAHRMHHVRLRLKRYVLRAHKIPPPSHGKSGYSNHGCRCRVCLRAASPRPRPLPFEHVLPADFDHDTQVETAALMNHPPQHWLGC